MPNTVLTVQADRGLAFLIEPMLLQATLPGCRESHVIATTREFGERLVAIDSFMTYVETTDPGRAPRIEEIEGDRRYLTPGTAVRMTMEDALFFDLQRRVVGVVLDHALARGYRMAVMRGDDEHLKASRDRQEIATLLLDDSVARMRVLRANGSHVGEMTFIFHSGNPEWILHFSCWDNPDIAELAAPGKALIDDHIAMTQTAGADSDRISP